MNREIKFRGKSLNTSLWSYGDLRQDNIRRKSYIEYEVDPQPIGQYTGLKDSTGKEIYEGDIVTIGLCTALVTWNEELATFALQFDFEDKVGRKSLGEWDDTIVISNIHDSPELLKGGEK